MKNNIKRDIRIVDVLGNYYVVVREVILVTWLLGIGIIASDDGCFNEYYRLIGQL